MAITLEATINELAPGGEGVAICPIDGEDRAVFVPGVLPGERVRAEVDTQTRPARGRLLAVLSPSASRVESPCPDVDRCGGCDWMHIAPLSQVEQHAKIVGKLLGTEVVTHVAPKTLGYRTRARVHVEAKRGRVAVGMFGRRTHAPVEVATCVVLDPAIEKMRLALGRDWLAGAEGRGEAQLALPGVLDLRWRGELPGAVFGRLEKAVAAGELRGARIFAGDVRVPATIGDAAPSIPGADGDPLRLAPGGFAQATDEGNALLAKRVVELALGVVPSGVAIELYAGAGNLSVLLARHYELTAVEHDHEACAAARTNLAARGLTGKIVEADAATFAIPKNAKLVVLDPPREGARSAAEALRTHKRRPAIVYVSCDPPTLARDVKILKEVYTLRSVDTFEMFPQTSHVETVAVLT